MFIIVFFVVPLSFLAPLHAQVDIRDRLTPFIDNYTHLTEHTVQAYENLILKNEFLLAPELSNFLSDFTRSEYSKLLDKQFKSYVQDLPTLILIYKQKKTEVEQLIHQIEALYLNQLNIHFSHSVYFISALFNTDGFAFLTTDNHVAFALNFRVIHTYSKAQLKILLLHEFFHLIQNETQKINVKESQDSIGYRLIAEGFAVFASSVLAPEFKGNDGLYLMDATLPTEFNKYAQEIATALLNDWDQPQSQKDHYYFKGSKILDKPWPPRSGYAVGYYIAQKLSHTIPSKKLLSMDYEQLAPLVKAELRKFK